MGAETPLIRKLQKFVRLSAEDERALDKLVQERIQKIGGREDVAREGDNPETLKVILSGWACRTKMLEDGRRQILSFFLPGDLCELNIYILREMDHTIAALTPLTYAEITRDKFELVTSQHPRIAQAFWWDTLVATAVQREWTLSVGQRTALERISHLFCELFIKLDVIGRTRRNRCEFPLLQSDLGEATGLSTVHVNRTLRELRSQNLIVLRGKELTIPDLERLKEVAMFNISYLHLEHESQELDPNEISGRAAR
jgi:CRP-like cAMP-binding protein